MEDQAFARVYRIGQKEKTQLVTMVVKKTIEERMMEIKRRKDDEISNVMNPLDGREVQKQLWRPFDDDDDDGDE